jgi:hypothetical protein
MINDHPPSINMHSLVEIHFPTGIGFSRSVIYASDTYHLISSLPHPLISKQKALPSLSTAGPW